jgi:hypothetical protein
MSSRLEALLDDLRRVAELPVADRNRCARRTVWLAEADADQQRGYVESALALDIPLKPEQDILLRTALSHLVRQRQSASAGSAGDAAEALAPLLVTLYRRLGPTSQARGQVLAFLAWGNSANELEELADLLVEDPPHDDGDVVLALSPLFRRRALAVEALFPRLLDALAHLPLAAAVLDLANYLARSGLAAEHPAAPRRAELAAMLGNLVGLLGKLEEGPPEGRSAQEISRMVQQSVSLAVSLCDALALIGDVQSVGKLNQALVLSHRRLKTEAAAALARLGDERGRKELVALAAEPVARLRVLAYAQELSLSERIDPKYMTPQARAEAELTVWLAGPTQFGVPPQSCELVDSRRQYWPGFDEPVDCFLFRFTYELTVEGQKRTYSNIGIAGPLAHAFTADLADLPPEDIYAAYAGWQAEHAEIREYQVEQLSPSDQTEVARLARRLQDAGYDDIEPQVMGYFFGEKALVAQARHASLRGVAIADQHDVFFYPERLPRRSIQAREALAIYKGRKLLRAFNP